MGVTKIIQHHVKYKEIHGVDKIVMMTHSEHRLLHNRLRKEGKCNISSYELNKISVAANHRTSKTREYQKNYRVNRQPREYPTHMKIKTHRCSMCTHEWVPRIKNVKSCPVCHSMRWNQKEIPEAHVRIAITAPETKEDIQDAEYEFYPDTAKEESV